MKQSTTRTILIVDDEKEATRTLHLGLRTQGYRALSANRGEEALKILSQRPEIEVILTDYSMPGMSGIELLQAIRAQKRGFPVIMMTAYGEKEVLVRAIKNSCNGFIEKPFSISEMINEIERVIDNSELSTTSFNELKELVPMLVHQINNPLTTIKGQASLGIVQSQENSLIQEKLSHILIASEKIEQISNVLLTLGKSVKDQYETLNIDELVKNCMELIAPTAKAGGVHLHYDCQTSETEVKANRFGLEQMIANIISNALDAMQHSSEKKLIIRQFESNGYCQLLFQDTGCGMSDELIARAFSPYFTTKRTGTGLGLELVKRVIGAHDGHISLDSKENEGTTMIISLPLENARQEKRFVAEKAPPQNHYASDKISAAQNK